MSAALCGSGDRAARRPDRSWRGGFRLPVLMAVFLLGPCRALNLLVSLRHPPRIGGGACLRPALRRLWLPIGQRSWPWHWPPRPLPGWVRGGWRGCRSAGSRKSSLCCWRRSGCCCCWRRRRAMRRCDAAPGVWRPSSPALPSGWGSGLYSSLLGVAGGELDHPHPAVRLRPGHPRRTAERQPADQPACGRGACGGMRVPAAMPIARRCAASPCRWRPDRWRVLSPGRRCCPSRRQRRSSCCCGAILLASAWKLAHGGLLPWRPPSA